jgi:hypothetical protein
VRDERDVLRVGARDFGITTVNVSRDRFHSSRVEQTQHALKMPRGHAAAYRFHLVENALREKSRLSNHFRQVKSHPQTLGAGGRRGGIPVGRRHSRA